MYHQRFVIQRFEKRHFDNRRFVLTPLTAVHFTSRRTNNYLFNLREDLLRRIINLTGNIPFQVFRHFLNEVSS